MPTLTLNTHFGAEAARITRESQCYYLILVNCQPPTTIIASSFACIDGYFAMDANLFYLNCKIICEWKSFSASR